MSNKFLGLDSINILKAYIDKKIASDTGSSSPGSGSSSGASVTVLSAYKYSVDKPLKPIGGSIKITGAIEWPNDWGPLSSVEGDLTKGSIYMSSKVFVNGQGTGDEWSDPIKVSTSDGKDGVDGKDGTMWTIGTDGFWYADGTKTDNKAIGTDGNDGTSITIVDTYDSESDLIAAFPNGPDPKTNAYVVGSDLYVWVNDAWKNIGRFVGETGPEGPRGPEGQTLYMHVKYADSITYDNNGDIIDVVFTSDNGESVGPYQGMYSDYVETDSDDFRSYTWFFIDAKKAVETEWGKYYITSNTISGKTVQSTTESKLIKDTVFETFEEDGTSKGTVIANGTETLGPAWQIRNSGEGYFAKGNIRWDANGSVEFGSDVKLSWEDNIEDKPTIPSIPEDLDEKLSKIDNYDQSLSNLSDTISNLSNDVQQHTEDIKNANDALDAAKTELAEGIKSVNESLNASVGENGTVTADLRAKAETLQQQAETLNDLSDAINNIGTDSSSILSPAKIAQLAITATNGTTIDEESVKSSWILGVIGDFGTINAENIKGTTIKGVTIQSAVDDIDSEEPTWKIESTGEGYLAGGNIGWDADGNGYLGGVDSSEAAISWSKDPFNGQKEVVIGSNSVRVRQISKIKVIENIRLADALERENSEGLSLRDLLNDDSISNIAYQYNKLIITGTVVNNLNDAFELNEDDNLLLNIDLSMHLPILGDEFEIIYSINGNSIKQYPQLPLKINYSGASVDLYGPNGHQEITIYNGSSIKFIRYADPYDDAEARFLYTVSGNWKQTI